jgi:hypothetical protein
MLKVRIWIWTLGLLFAQLFVLCVLRDLASPLSPGLRRSFEIFLPGFKWLTQWRFLLGLAESFLWGVYAALVLVPIINISLLKHRQASTVQEHETRHEHRAAA